MPSRLDEFEYSTISLDRIKSECFPIYLDSTPKIITLCGSTRFKDAFESEQARLTNEGNIVISVGRFGHKDGLAMDGDLKKRLDELHFRKIDISDEIRVINLKRAWCPSCEKFCGDSLAAPTLSDDNRLFCRRNVGSRGMVMYCGQTKIMKPYVGESTCNEIEYANKTGKIITYMNPPKE